MKKTVGRLSAEELASIGAGTTVSPVVYNKPKKEVDPIEYTARLSDSDIENYFAKFGYISHERDFAEDSIWKHISVLCNGFEVSFDDYLRNVIIGHQYDKETIAVESNPALKPTKQGAEFDIEALQEYAENLGYTPEQIISELVTAELFADRFPSYGVARQKFAIENLRKSYEQLPMSMRKSLKNIQEMADAHVKSTANKSYYGYYNIDHMIKKD